MLSRPSRRFLAFGTIAGVAVAAPAVETVLAQGAQPESALGRITRNKVLRVAVLPGEAPFFYKDIASGEWSGMGIDMAKDIAGILDAKLEYLESTYGNSVLDLQADKIDLAFFLAPTPRRALVVAFTHPPLSYAFGIVGRKGFSATNWGDLNDPKVKVAVDMGSAQETAARRFAPNASFSAFKTRDECILAVQSGRADCVVLTVLLGLTAVKKNPSLGTFQVLGSPKVQLPSAMAVRKEPDPQWRDFLNAWVDYNRGIGQMREWLVSGLALGGITAQDIPSNVEF